MNRSLFHFIGYAAPVCLVPYLLTLAAGEFRDRFPVLFFFAVVLALAGFISGILWLMFFIEYRGVWFGKEDRGRPQKFEDADLPVIKETGTRLQERLKQITLYSWDMVVRPVLLPDGRRVFNIRYDFVSAVTEPFLPAEPFAAVELVRGKRYAFHFRVCPGDEGGLEFLEFDPAKRWRLTSPASRKVSALDLRNSAGAVEAIVALFSRYDFNWQAVFVEYHAGRKPYLNVAVQTFPTVPVELAFGDDAVKLSGGKRECVSFRLNPDLAYAGHLKKLSLFGQLFSA